MAEHVLINEDNPLPTSQFCMDELDSTTSLNMILESNLRLLGHFHALYVRSCA